MSINNRNSFELYHLLTLFEPKQCRPRLASTYDKRKLNGQGKDLYRRPYGEAGVVEVLSGKLGEGSRMYFAHRRLMSAPFVIPNL